jgi:hypothetical protein
MSLEAGLWWPAEFKPGAPWLILIDSFMTDEEPGEETVIRYLEERGELLSLMNQYSYIKVEG